MAKWFFQWLTGLPRLGIKKSLWLAPKRQFVIVTASSWREIGFTFYKIPTKMGVLKPFFFSPSMALWGFSGIWDVDALMWSFYHQHHAWNHFLSVSEGRFELWDADFHYASHRFNWEEYLYKHHKDPLRMRQSSPLYKAPKTLKTCWFILFFPTWMLFRNMIKFEKGFVSCFKK